MNRCERFPASSARLHSRPDCAWRSPCSEGTPRLRTGSQVPVIIGCLGLKAIDCEEAMNALLETFHDAVIASITVSLEGGTALLQLDRVGTTSVWVAAEGLLGLNCPRREPWGTGGAASVNEIREHHEPDGTSLHIEMQSGDIIELQARRITVIGS